MEYQKIKILLGNRSNQPAKYRIKNLVEINDDARTTHNANSQIKSKTTLLKSSLRDDSDACVLEKGNISMGNTAATDADANNTNIKAIF